MLNLDSIKILINNEKLLIMKKILSIALLCLFANLSFGVTNFETTKHKTETIVSQFESTNVDCPNFIAVNFVAANSFPEVVLPNDFLIKNTIFGDVIVDKEKPETLKLFNLEFLTTFSENYNFQNSNKDNKISVFDFGRIKDYKIDKSLMLQKNYNKNEKTHFYSWELKELFNYSRLSPSVNL